VEIAEEALAAVARTRAQGLHFWGQAVGVSTVGRDDDATLMRLDAATSEDTTALATLSDLCLGFAVRARLGSGHGLATASLSLQHTAAPRGAVVCGSRVVWTDGERRALTQAYLEDETGALVGSAQAWFLVVPLGPDVVVTPMPWERTPVDVPVLAPGDLSPTEHAAAVAATRARARAASSGLPLSEELLGLSWKPDGDDGLLGTSDLGPHLANRVGDAQGGAIYGAAATAARRLAGPGQRLAGGAMQYLRPGRGEQLAVTATAVRRGRRAEFVEVEVAVDGRVAASAHFTFLAE